jgi:predicted nucleic-acid-binding Zn-ribbon protein
MNQSSPNISRRQCPQCGGAQVQTTMSTYRGEGLQLIQSYRSVELFKKRSSTSPIVYLTCLSCGLTSLYATQPDNLVPDNMER